MKGQPTNETDMKDPRLTELRYLLDRNRPGRRCIRIANQDLKGKLIDRERLDLMLIVGPFSHPRSARRRDPGGAEVLSIIGAAELGAFPMAGRLSVKGALGKDFSNIICTHTIAGYAAGQLASAIAGGYC